MGVKGKKNRPVQARVRVAGRQLALGGHTLRLGVPPETADGRSCVHCDGTGHRAEPSSTTSDHERCVMHIRLRSLTTAATAALLLTAASADAAPDPRGIWIDHTGRGAVEIMDCDGALCGRLVWLKDAENGEACGIQILGNVRPAGSGVWDKGWIYDPEQDAKYSGVLKPIGEDR